MIKRVHHLLLSSSVAEVNQERTENKSVPSRSLLVPCTFPPRSLFGLLVDKPVEAIC